MKKALFMLLTVWAGVLSAHATNDLTGSDVSIPQGKVGTISIELNNDDYEFTAFTFKLTLPEGLSFVLNGSGKPTFEKGTRFDESHTLSSSVSGQTATFGCLSGEKAPIAGKGGMLLNVYVQSDAELAVGAELSATLSEVTFTTMDVTEVVFSDATVNISIAEPRLVFDENSTTLPSYTAGEKDNVRMLRTIKAGEWSTIVLPFTLTKTKAEAAFGADVQLLEFSGFETEYADDEDVTPDGISLNFTPYTMTAKKGMTGGKLYLIKTAADITSFDADEVTLADAVTEVNVTDDYDTKGKFTGTLVKTSIPADGLFLSGDQFWYSAGLTKVKAFRGWFMLDAVLDKATNFEAKVRLVIEDEGATGVGGIVAGIEDGANDWHTLDGRKLGGKPTEKGIYIVGGKKVSVQ